MIYIFRDTFSNNGWGTIFQQQQQSMAVVDKFGTDARSITRTLESIKDPEQLEKAVQNENVEKFIDRSKKANN